MASPPPSNNAARQTTLVIVLIASTAGLLAGGIFGLLLGWNAEAGPQHLGQAYAAKYVQCVADAYALLDDDDMATDRMRYFADYAQAIGWAERASQDDPDALARLAELESVLDARQRAGDLLPPPTGPGLLTAVLVLVALLVAAGVLIVFRQRIGFLLVIVVIVLSLWGPNFAPHDPMEEHVIVRVGDDWVIPPFTAFAVPGFPLGSDQFGRDLASRILHGIGPTMTMVSIVALVRLALGVLFGLAAGWSNGRLGRALDGLIAGALAIPVLIVALGVIAAVGVELGLPAFIIGLSLTGWAESARVVREETRLIRGTLYIEAARALGAVDLHIVFRHVLRQVLPLAWMLFALEISSTLMATAGLGFLGYYIGGDVWVTVGDFVARRVSGQPELGQMLSTGWTRLDQPWSLMVVGSVVFFIVLAFNLMGEDIRRSLNVHQARRIRWLDDLFTTVGGFIEARLALPVFQRVSQPGFGYSLLVAGLLIAFGLGGFWLGGQFAAVPEPTTAAAVPLPTATPVPPTLAPGETLEPTLTPTPPALMAPAVETVVELDLLLYEQGFERASDGSFAVVTSELDDNDEPLWRVLRLDSDGSTRWEAPLPIEPVRGSPEIGPEGNVYVSDREGGLTAWDAAGNQLWRVQSEGGFAGGSGPLVHPNGTVFYKSGNTVLAVSPAGDLLWSNRSGTSRNRLPLELSPDGTLLFFAEDIFVVADGTLISHEFDFPIDTYHGGDDGQLYLRSDNTLIRWAPDGDDATILETASWNYVGVAPNFSEPTHVDVTADGLITLMYTGSFGAGRTFLAWMDGTGSVYGTLGIEEPFAFYAEWMHVEPDLLTYLCGSTNTDSITERPTCRAQRPGEVWPAWVTQFDDDDFGYEGAFFDAAEHAIYLGTTGGTIYRLDPRSLTPLPETAD